MTEDAKKSGTRTFEMENVFVNNKNIGLQKMTNGRSAIDAVLDQSALQKLQQQAGNGRKTLAELIDLFLEEAPELLVAMRNSLEKADPGGLRAAAGTLKSSANNFGATHLAQLCQTLETIGQKDTINGAAELVIRAEAEYEQVRTALKSVRNE